MSELQKELDKDLAFINEVSERIYCESDDWEDSLAEPEWIMEMRDIADKYLRRFKAAENGRRQVVQDKAKLIEMSEQKLNENQEIVLEWLKREHFDSYIKSVLSNLYFYVNMTAIGDLENEEIQEMVNAYEELSQEAFAQVLQAFATWALDQC